MATETGAGQWGTALGIAISEAVEDAATHQPTTKYSLGSVLNHVLMHQTIIGLETQKQLEKANIEPDILIGCVGGGSNFGGFALPFVREKIVNKKKARIIAVEPTVAPALTKGVYTYDFGDTAGMTPLVKMHTPGSSFLPAPVHAGGPRYHGVAPIISALLDQGFIEAIAVPQNAVFEAAVQFARAEGIIPAPESAHAIRVAVDEAVKCKERGENKMSLHNESGADCRCEHVRSAQCELREAISEWLGDCFVAKTAPRNDNSATTPTVDSCLPFVYNTRKSSAVVSVKELVLRVVPLEDVLLHEQVEARRVEKLTARLQVDWLLKNPPIVTQCDGKSILLEGATRVTSLRQLGCRDVVVQIVDYARPGLVLETWNHMLIGLSMREFFESLQQLPGLRVENSVADEAGDALAQRKSIGTILLADGEAYSLRMEGASSLASEARLLNGVVAAYEGRGEMDRVAHMDVERLRSENSRLSALVIFPRYRPDEIRYLALNGSKLPTGITHHVIPGRAMRINIPLDVLRADEPLEQKNEWLDEWMKTKMREQHVRYYQEPVFLFDE